MKIKRFVLILHLKILVILDFEIKSISLKFYFFTTKKSREKFKLFEYILNSFIIFSEATHPCCFYNSDRNKHSSICSQVTLWSYGMGTKMNFLILFSGFLVNILWVKDKFFSFKNCTVLNIFFFFHLTSFFFLK